MARRRTSKKKTQKQIISAIIFIILAIITYFTEPWQYIPKDDIGSRNEVQTTDLQVHFIDVGQADATLVRVPTADGMKNMLIDAGTSTGYGEDVILDYLSDLGISTLHYFVLTHPDFDHISAAVEVMEQFEIEMLLMNEGEGTSGTWAATLAHIDENDIPYTFTDVGDTYLMGDASFTVLGPIRFVDDTNENSIVMRMDYGETSFLFTGDAEKGSEADMVATHPSSVFACDVLKAGHHGSGTSTSEALLRAANPALAVISCGKGNKYGHPHDSVLERLTNAGVEILRTDLEGTIIICSDKTEVYRLTSN